MIGIIIIVIFILLVFIIHYRKPKKIKRKHKPKIIKHLPIFLKYSKIGGIAGVNEILLMKSNGEYIYSVNDNIKSGVLEAENIRDNINNKYMYYVNNVYCPYKSKEITQRKLMINGVEMNDKAFDDRDIREIIFRATQ